MTLLRTKKNQNPSDFANPFEDVPLFNPYVMDDVVASDEKPTLKHTAAKKDKRSGKGFSIVSNSVVKNIGFLALICVTGLATYKFFQSHTSLQTEATSVLFDVKVIDVDGRPVAGAVVSLGQKKVGTTDSFGEWRRYFKAQTGSTLVLQIQKNSDHQLLSLTKNFAVPLKPSSGKEIEFKNQLQLVGSPAVEKVAQKTAIEKVVEKAGEKVVEKAIEKPEGAAAEQKTEHVVEFTGSGHKIRLNQLNYVTQATSQFMNQVALFLKAELDTITPQAYKSTVIRLSYLADKRAGSKGLFLVEFGEDPSQSFLKNVTDDPKTNAYLIAKTYKQMTSPQDVASQPRSFLKIGKALTQNEAIFIGGMPLKKVNHDTFTYVRSDAARMNVTVVRNQNIVYRENVFLKPQLHKLELPSNL